MPATKKQMEYIEQYKASHYERIKLQVPIGRKITVEQTAKLRGLSVNGLINSLLADACGLSLEEWKKQE